MDLDAEFCDSPAAFRSNAWVLATTFRAHLHHLLGESGLPWRAIALYARLPAGLIRRLAGPHPPKRIPVDVAASLLAITPADLARLGRCAGRWEPTVRRVSWLAEQGHGTTSLSHMLQLPREEVERMLVGRRWCTQRVELLARAAVHAHLQREAVRIELSRAA